MVFKNVIALLSVILLLHTSCTKTISDKMIVGTWKPVGEGYPIYKFYGNRTFSLIHHDDKTIIDSSHARYKLVHKSDTLWLEKRFYYTFDEGAKRKRFRARHSRRRRRAILINGDYLTRVTYKTNRGPLKNHIDEYSVYERQVDNPKPDSLFTRKITYVFPEGFTGGAWIAFNQEDGVAPQYDNEGNPVLRIPESGLLKTSLHEDAFATANKCYRMVVDSSNGQGLYPFQTFDKFARIDSTCCAPNENVAFMQGFNQTSREHINDNIFNEDINGNVITIFIGTFQEFTKSPLHPWTVNTD